MFYRAKKFNKDGFITDSSPTYIQLCDGYIIIESVLSALQEANCYINNAAKVHQFDLYYESNSSFSLRWCGKNIFYLTKVRERISSPPSAVSWYGDISAGSTYTVTTAPIVNYT